MAGPSVAVRVLGDLTGFQKSMADTATKGSGVAASLKGAFTGALGVLNRTGVLGPFSEALGGISEAISGIVEHAKGIGPALTGAGGAIAGIGLGFSAIGSKDQAAHKQLQDAIQATGKDYEQFGGQIEEAVKHQEHYGRTANQTQDALRILTQATGDPAKALKYLGETSDLAAAKHISLEDAATKLGKAYNGNTRILKEFGINVASSAKAQQALEKDTKAVTVAGDAHAKAIQHLKDLHEEYAGKTKLTVAQQIALRDAQQKVTDTGKTLHDDQLKLRDAQKQAGDAAGKHGDALGLLGDKIKGQADAQAQTFTGHLGAMKAHFEDMAASLGAKYGPAITAVGTGIAGLGIIFQAAPAAMGLVSAAWDVMTGSELAALAPYLLIAAAAAAVGVAIYELVKHWSTVWAAMKAAVQVVWQWIKDNWPLLLTIILGPIGLAAAQLIKHWQRIKDDAAAVWKWIVQGWNSLVTFFSGIPARIMAYLTSLWNQAKSAAETVWKWVVQGWNTLVTFFSGIPARILAFLDGLWRDEKNGAETVWKWVVQGWNSLVDFFSGIPKRVSGYISGMWDDIKQGATDVSTWVSDKWDDIVGTIQGLPGRIARAAAGMFNGIWDAFKGAINSVINGWNGLHFHIGGGTFLGIKVPSFDLGVPHIPTLAQGGLITETGFIYAHKGEAITPLPANLTAGPAIHIEHATFEQPLDVDLLLKRAAWAMQTRSA
jgi:phage-related protein